MPSASCSSARQIRTSVLTRPSSCPRHGNAYTRRRAPSTTPAFAVARRLAPMRCRRAAGGRARCSPWRSWLGQPTWSGACCEETRRWLMRLVPLFARGGGGDFAQLLDPAAQGGGKVASFIGRGAAGEEALPDLLVGELAGESIEPAHVGA